MAKGEVQVKDINVVKLYNQQLGDVIAAIDDHMSAFQRALEAKLQELQAMTILCATGKKRNRTTLLATALSQSR